MTLWITRALVATILFAAATLASCGGGSPAPVVTMYGDSLAVGAIPEPAGVPARFIDVPPAQRLQQLVGPRYDVQLRAESGASIQQILLGDKNWPWAPFAQQIEADHPSIVLLRFGGADGLYGTDREAFRADLVEIVREAKSHGVAVYLVGVIRTAQYEEVASAFDQINRDVAQAEGVTFINLRDLAFDQATDTTTDRLHPSQAYSDRIVQRIADVVTSTNP